MKKNKWNKRQAAFLFCTLTVLCMVVLAGVKKSQEQIVLTFGMFSGSSFGESGIGDSEVVEAAIDKFCQIHPDVRIEFESGILQKDYPEWLAGKFLLGQEPDVFMVMAEDFGMLASKGALLELDKRMEDDVSFEKNSFYEAPLTSGQYEQVQYALPYESILTLMCVNESLLTDACVELPENDWTWEELHAICRRLTSDTNHDGILDRFGICEYDWKDAVYSNGASLFNESGTENYVNKWPFISAVKFVYALDGLNQGNQVTRKDFEEGKVAFCPISFSEYKRYKSYPWKAWKFTEFEWRCMDMPSGPQGNTRSEVESLLMGISAHTDQEDLAWEFLKLLTCDEEIQTKILTASDGIPVQRCVMESEQAEKLLNPEDLENGIDAGLLDHAMDRGALSSRFRKYESASALLDDGIQEVMKSDKDIVGALVSLHRKLNNHLKNE